MTLEGLLFSAGSVSSLTLSISYARIVVPRLLAERGCDGTRGRGGYYCSPNPSYSAMCFIIFHYGTWVGLSM